MNFSDTIKVQVLCYEPYYAVIGEKVLILGENDEYTEIEEEMTAEFFKNGRYDADGNPVEPVQKWLTFGKEKNALIMPNSRGKEVVLNDGTKYTYSYEVIAKLNKRLYPLIPKEGDRILLQKSDGTIKKDMEVKGFVTFKRRYIKLWL